MVGRQQRGTLGVGNHSPQGQPADVVVTFRQSDETVVNPLRRSAKDDFEWKLETGVQTSANKLGMTSVR